MKEQGRMRIGGCPLSDLYHHSTIFAVEIHFQSAGYEETTVFNGFLYFLAGMSATNN